MMAKTEDFLALAKAGEKGVRLMPENGMVSVDCDAGVGWESIPLEIRNLRPSGVVLLNHDRMVINMTTLSRVDVVVLSAGVPVAEELKVSGGEIIPGLWIVPRPWKTDRQ